MDEVERVGLWIGLLASVAGIVLAVVAIWFAQRVDRDSRRVAEKTITSLQKIESAVDKQSNEVTNLVKVAWTSMFGSETEVHDPGADADTISHRAFGAPQEVADSSDGNGIDEADKRMLETLVDQFDRTIGSDMGSARRPGAGIRLVLGRLQTLSPRALELARILGNGRHLTSTEYAQLADQDPELVDELREASLLRPFKGRVKGRNESVYWFPPGVGRWVPLAMTLHNQEYPDAHDSIHKLLDAVGYHPDSMERT
jgi:hypothetical protein